MAGRASAIVLFELSFTSILLASPAIQVFQFRDQLPATSQYRVRLASTRRLVSVAARRSKPLTTLQSRGCVQSSLQCLLRLRSQKRCLGVFARSLRIFLLRSEQLSSSRPRRIPTAWFPSLVLPENSVRAQAAAFACGSFLRPSVRPSVRAC